MGVSAVIVTYNRLDVLKECLKHLLDQTYNLDYIVVVNNASTDGTKQYLEHANNDKLIVKNLAKNTGGAGGFSLGTKIAYERTNSNYFWLMDDDTMPTSNALNKLVTSANILHNHFGFLCSNVRFKNNYPCNIPRTDYFWDIKQPGNLIRVDIATFVSFFVSRNNVSKLGLPIAKMFIWGDDFEYSLRLSTKLPSYFVSDSIVIHATKAFSSKSTVNTFFNMPRGREKFMQYSFRNELYAIRKHKGTKKAIKKVIKELVFIVKIPFLAKHDKLRKLYYTCSGLLKGLFFNPKVKFPNEENRK